eukprot:7734632-Pyramimonas_sp.AAC.1
MSGKRRRAELPPVPDGDAALSRAEAGEQLTRELKHLYSTGVLSAKSFCELAFLASAAGAAGDCSTWGVRPSDSGSSGRFQKHVERVLYAKGVRGVEPIPVHIPLQSRETGRRAWTSMLVRPLHELLHAEVAGKSDDMRRALGDRSWPRVHRERHVYLDSDPGELVVPVAVFMDSAQYGGAAGAGRQKSILTISLINLITGVRHIGLEFRKHLLPAAVSRSSVEPRCPGVWEVPCEAMGSGGLAEGVGAVRWRSRRAHGVQRSAVLPDGGLGGCIP